MASSLHPQSRERWPESGREQNDLPIEPGRQRSSTQDSGTPLLGNLILIEQDSPRWLPRSGPRVTLSPGRHLRQGPASGAKVAAREKGPFRL